MNTCAQPIIFMYCMASRLIFQTITNNYAAFLLTFQKTLFLLVNSDLHSPDSDDLLIVSKLKLGDGLDQMQFLLKRGAVLHVIHWKMSFILF